MKFTKIGGGTKSGAKINWDKVYETIQFLEFDMSSQTTKN